MKTRRQFGSYENDVPIDDEWVVLDLLVRRRGDHTVRELVRIWDEPYVRIRHCHDFADDHVTDFMVTDRVADSLLAKCLVSGKPEWGYTDMKCLRANDAGERALFTRRREFALEDRLTTERWYFERRLK